MDYISRVPAYEDWKLDPCWSALPWSPQLQALKTAWGNYAECCRGYEQLADQYGRTREELQESGAPRPALPHRGTRQDMPRTLDDIRHEIEWVLHLRATTLQQLQVKFDEWLDSSSPQTRQLPAAAALGTTLQAGLSRAGSVPQVPATREGARRASARRASARRASTPPAPRPPESNGNTVKPYRGLRIALPFRPT